MPAPSLPRAPRAAALLLALTPLLAACLPPLPAASASHDPWCPYHAELLDPIDVVEGHGRHEWYTHYSLYAALYVAVQTSGPPLDLHLNAFPCGGGYTACAPVPFGVTHAVGCLVTRRDSVNVVVSSDSWQDIGFRLVAISLPFVPLAERTPYGGCSFFGDTNGNLRKDPHETTLLTVPCDGDVPPRTATHFAEDGSCWVYYDDNDNGFWDQGELRVVGPCVSPVAEDHDDGTCLVYNDRNLDRNRTDDETSTGDFPCPAPRPALREDGTCVLFDDLDNDGGQDENEPTLGAPLPCSTGAVEDVLEECVPGWGGDSRRAECSPLD